MSSDHIHGDLVAFLRKRGISLPSGGIILPTVGILISESLLYFGFIWLALWGHLVTLIVCVLAPLYLEDDVGMFQVFVLVPVFRLVNLGMPVFFELTVYWFPLIYGPLIPAIYLIGRANSPVLLKVGWKPALLGLPLAIPVSTLLAVVEYRILQPEALIPAWDVPQLLVISIVMIGFVGLVEEMLFRGVLQRSLVDRLGFWPGLLLTSGIFGVMHSGYHMPEELLFAASIGLLFGFIYNETDSLALITIMHGFLNIVLFAILPLKGPLHALL